MHVTILENLISKKKIMSERIPIIAPLENYNF